MTTASVSTQKRQLRKTLRQRRRALTPGQQRCAALSLRDRVLSSARLQRSARVACYLASDGEIDTWPLIRACLVAGKALYLPVIDRRGMRFLRYRSGDPLQQHHFGMLQPRDMAGECAALDLDLVMLPLVGFDRRGGRLGMGGGYYDRAFRYARRRASRPWLLGLAHACQELPEVPRQGWDRDLHAIATDRAWIGPAG